MIIKQTIKRGHANAGTNDERKRYTVWSLCVASHLSADAPCQSQRQWAVLAPASAAHGHGPSGVGKGSDVQHGKALETDYALALQRMLQSRVDDLQGCAQKTGHSRTAGQVNACWVEFRDRCKHVMIVDELRASLWPAQQRLVCRAGRTLASGLSMEPASRIDRLVFGFKSLKEEEAVASLQDTSELQIWPAVCCMFHQHCTVSHTNVQDH